jgi:hypothetical protein
VNTVLPLGLRTISRKNEESPNVNMHAAKHEPFTGRCVHKQI